MKKLLIVSGGDLLRRTIASVMEGTFGFSTRVCDHNVVRRELDNFEPTHILVRDYAEPTHGHRWPRDGFDTWNYLIALKLDVRMVRLGRDAYNYPDYIREPFRLAELATKLLGEQTSVGSANSHEVV